MRLKYLITSFLLFCICIANAQQDKPLQILFVGNSFIYFNNLPQVFSAMAESQGEHIETRQSTVGGSNLEQHWKEEKNTQTRKLLNEQQWDYVVFNNHSLSAIDTPENFELYGKKFADLVQEKGAKPIFMTTWGYKSNPLFQDKIEKAYKKLADETGAQTVPAGPLMAQARHWRPDLELYHDDKHPNPIGTYLIGLSFYKFFIGKPTAALPERITTIDRNGEKLYLLFLSTADADFLQMLVDDFEFELVSE